MHTVYEVSMGRSTPIVKLGISMYLTDWISVAMPFRLPSTLDNA